MQGLARRFAVVAFGATAALGLAVTTAAAGTTAGTWTVSPGGAATAAATAPTLGVPLATLNCDSSAATVALKSGSGLSGDGIGDISALGFDGCNLAGIAFTVKTDSFNWKLNVSGVNASHPDWVDGSITGVSAHISGSGCTADFTGAVYGHYENDTHTLVVDGSGSDLVASNANCLGLINNGDVASFNASYVVDPAQTITQD